MSSNRKKQKHIEHHEEHVDERWLVSYADMMTLLFGLFVILFSIASENQGKFDENLKSISDSATLAKNNDEEKKEEKIEKEKPEIVQPELLQAEIDNLKKQLVLSNADIEKLKSENQQNYQKSVEDLNMIEKLKVQIQDLSVVAKSSENQLELEKNRTKELEKILNTNSKNGQAAVSKEIQFLEQINQLKQERQKLLENNSKLEEANADLKKTIKDTPDVKKIERQISSLQNSKDENTQIIKQQASQLNQLTKQVTDLEQENKKLQSDIKEYEKNNNDNQTYLFVLFKWSTEKHDLDLTVTDPKGNLFSFKRKTNAGSKGVFSLDSRSGPGAEIWQASDPTPGTYTITVKMYNNYGNLQPAALSGSILSNKSSINLTDKKIESKGGSEVKFKVEVDSKGYVKLI